METEPPKMIAGCRVIADRLRGLHEDRRGQILPLIFFLGVAFFTSVLLVVNTGRAVNFRIENQNAVDAAAVSGATSMARGMNYLASNNIAQARLLSVVVVLRAIPKATDLGEKTLKVWETVVVPAMKIAAQALKGSPWTIAIGVALDIAAEILKVKIKLEKIILKAIKNVIAEGFGWFDKAIKNQTPQYQRENPSGLAWTLMRGMSLMGQGIAYWGPVVSQYTAQVVYQNNLSHAGGSGFALLVPLYPGMPVCKAGFARFQPPLANEPTEFVAEIADPIVIAGWVVLTLSFWPLYFNTGIDYQMKALFQESGGESETADCPGAFSNTTDFMDSANCEGSSPDWAGSRSDEQIERCRGACRKWWIENKSVLLKQKQDQLRAKEVRRAQIGSDGVEVLGQMRYAFPHKGELSYREKVLEKAKNPDDPGEASSWTPETPGEREGELEEHGKKIGETPEGSAPPEVDPVEEAQKEVDRLNNQLAGPPPLTDDNIVKWRITGGEVHYWEREQQKAQAAIDANDLQIAALERAKRASGATAAEKAALQARINDLESENGDYEDDIEEAKTKIEELLEEDNELRKDIDDLQDDVDELQGDIDELTEKSTEPPEGDPPGTTVQGGDKQKEHKLDKKYYPYLLHVPAGSWPRTFTVYVIAGRGSKPPLGASDNFFGLYGETFQNTMPVGFAYAGARVISPSAADLWISNWRAKLVRVRAADFPTATELLGRLPGKCDGYPQTSGEGAPGSQAVSGRVGDATQNTAPAGDPASQENPSSMRDKIDKVIQFFNKH